MADIGIVIHGMDKFVAKIEQVSDQVTSTLAGKSTKAAAELTVEEARPEVPVLTGRASESLKVIALATTAVAEGGDGIDYYGWLEFGGLAGHIVRESVPEGRYLFPASEKAVMGIVEIMTEELDDVVSAAGLEVE